MRRHILWGKKIGKNGYDHTNNPQETETTAIHARVGSKVKANLDLGAAQKIMVAS